MSTFCTIHDGRITLPAELIEELGLREGDQIQFVRKEADVTLHASGKPSLEYIVKHMRFFKNFEESQAWARDIRGRDDEDL